MALEQSCEAKLLPQSQRVERSYSRPRINGECNDDLSMRVLYSGLDVVTSLAQRGDDFIVRPHTDATEVEARLRVVQPGRC